MTTTVWREVSKDEYYKQIGKLDVNGRIVNSQYPYTMEHTSPSGIVHGRHVGYISEATSLAEFRYYLPKEA